MSTRDDIAAEVFEGAEPVVETREEVVDGGPSEVTEAANGEEEKKVERQEEPDPWAGTAPALREQLEELGRKVSSLDEISTRLKTTEGRVGALQSELAKKAAAETKKEGDAAPTKKQLESAKTSEQWAALKEDYPEWADALEGKLAETRAEIADALPDLEKLSGVFDERTSALEQKMADAIEVRLVEFKYPDFKKRILSKPEFWGWFQTQPPELQKLSQSKRAEDAIRILDTYHEHMKPVSKVAQERKRRLEQAEGHNTVVQKPVKTEADMTPKELRDSIAKNIWSD